MARSEVRDLVKEFYKEYGYSKSKDINLEDTYVAITSFWKYIKKCMEREDLPKIRLKYFGVLYVREGRAKHLLKKTKDYYDKKIISEDRYKKVTNMITEYLKNAKETDNIE